MTKSSPKKKHTKRDSRRSVDSLEADCRSLAQRLETLAFTMHAQQRATREALDYMLASKESSLQEQARIDALANVHDIARQTSCDSSEMAAALRRGASMLANSVAALIIAARRTGPDFQTEKF